MRAEPKLRSRDAALRLGVSEAELLAARCGSGVERLTTSWSTLLSDLGSLGEVMALTRNEQAVHEKVGRYAGIEISASNDSALVTGEEIDLRLRLSQWRFGYAVAGEAPGGRASLQFFDDRGTAVHKIFLREESDQDAYRRLVARHRSEDQRPGERIEEPKTRATNKRVEATVDRDALRAHWEALTDTHQFAGLLREFGLSRQQAFRLIGPRYAEPVMVESFVTALEVAALRALPIMVFVPNGGALQIHTGPVKTLRRIGPWFNVLDPNFNLHLQDGGISSAWVVRKPTSDGDVSSLEIFDAGDNPIAWMFGERKPGRPERDAWRTVLAGLSRLDRAAQ